MDNDRKPSEELVRLAEFFAEMDRELGKADPDHITPEVAASAARKARETEIVSVKIYDWDADETHVERMTLDEYNRHFPAADSTPAPVPAPVPVPAIQVKSIKVWRSPDKRECRIYAKLADGREGCYYKTGNRWHPAKSYDGQLTPDEWKLVREVGIVDGAWRTVYF